MAVPFWNSLESRNLWSNFVGRISLTYLKAGFIITSSEIEELRSVCDRIAIINEGKVAGILSPKADILEFGKMMVGIKEERDE